MDEKINYVISDEEMPVMAKMKVIGTSIKYFDPCEDMDDEEREAYWDFIQWKLTEEHAVLNSIPRPKNERDFWEMEIDEFGNNTSAFNTYDYERLHPFDKYHYKLKKIYERVTDLALLHSCISHAQGKQNIRQRFVDLVEKEFRDKACFLYETLKNYSVWLNKEKIIDEIKHLNSCIRKCNWIWKTLAYST